jgi:hypothetical protein
MAGGATTALGVLTIVDSICQGGLWIDTCTLVGDADYPTGGTAGLLAELRRQKKAPGLAIVSVEHAVGAAASWHLEYLPATDKLLAYDLTAGAGDHTQEGAGGNLSGTTFNIVIVSK